MKKLVMALFLTGCVHSLTTPPKLVRFTVYDRKVGTVEIEGQDTLAEQLTMEATSWHKFLGSVIELDDWSKKAYSTCHK